MMCQKGSSACVCIVWMRDVCQLSEVSRCKMGAFCKRCVRNVCYTIVHRHLPEEGSHGGSVQWIGAPRTMDESPLRQQPSIVSLP